MIASPDQIVIEPAQDLRAPFPWFGGKRRIAPMVWSRFGDVPNYVEPFAGSLAVLLGRPSPPRIETVNDADAHLANFWRAVQHDPESVAQWADWPVNEADLHARHLWLVNTGAERVERLKTDPDFYDPKVAGWWLWGICQWIGSGWCSGKGPWRTTDSGRGIQHKRPHLGNAGRGAQRQLPFLARAGMGMHRQLPHLGNAGMGVHRQLPYLAYTGMGVHQQLPHLGDAADGQCDRWTAYLTDYMSALADRLRRVRVCCGDWSRVLGSTPTFMHGLTAVFLDPPYSHEERDSELYATEMELTDQVREWALANGNNPLMRIALCGYEGEHDMPDTWETVRWKARGGYGNQSNNRARENAHREMVWFSPHCLRPDQPRQLELIG